MGKLNLIIQEDIDQKFRAEVFKRKGMKKGNLTEALEEAMLQWTENDVIKELEETATSKVTTALTKDKAIDTLGKMGKVSLGALSRISHNSDCNALTKDKALNTINALLSREN